MEITNTTKIRHLQIAGICYVLAGLGFIFFGYPFWFLHAVDSDPKGHLLAPFVFLQDDVATVIIKTWYLPLSAIALFVGAYSLLKSGEPIGTSRKRNFLYVSMAGGISYFLSLWLILPFAPLGAFLNALGMILISFASFKSRIWKGWKLYTPLLIGLFPFVFMFPLVIITHHRPAYMIGFWGIPWMLLGIAAWKRSKDISLFVVDEVTVMSSSAKF